MTTFPTKPAETSYSTTEEGCGPSSLVRPARMSHADALHNFAARRAMNFSKTALALIANAFFTAAYVSLCRTPWRISPSANPLQAPDGLALERDAPPGRSLPRGLRRGTANPRLQDNRARRCCHAHPQHPLAAP